MVGSTIFSLIDGVSVMYVRAKSFCIMYTILSLLFTDMYCADERRKDVNLWL